MRISPLTPEEEKVLYKLITKNPCLTIVFRHYRNNCSPDVHRYRSGVSL